MGMTLTEKILARHAGLDRVEPGQIIIAKVDLVLANELSAAVAISVMRGMKGASKVFDREQDRARRRPFRSRQGRAVGEAREADERFRRRAADRRTSSTSDAAASSTSFCRKKAWSRRAS